MGFGSCNSARGLENLGVEDKKAQTNTGLDQVKVSEHVPKLAKEACLVNFLCGNK